MQAMQILTRCRRAADDQRRLSQQIRRRQDAEADTEGLEKQLAERREAYAVETAVACVLLDQLPELHSGVLHRYYILRETTAVIAARMHYSQSYVRRVKRDAERRLAELPPETVTGALPRWYAQLYDEEGGSHGPELDDR